jgi:hypothetical protein
MRYSRMRKINWTLAKDISRNENLGMFGYAYTVTHAIVDTK